MKLIFTILCFCEILAGSAFAADAIYINDSPTANPPPIDARAFLNRSLFTIDSPSIVSAYTTKDTSCYTNTASGVMSAVNGFQFLLVTNATKKVALNFINQGVINGGTFLQVQASNIVNTGPMSVGSQGRMELTGGSVTLNRNGLRAGDTPGQFCSSTFINTETNYFNDFGVQDLYWGTGSNNFVNNKGPLMNLATLSQQVDPPFVLSPQHQVIFGGFTNLVQLFGFDYAPYVFSNQVAPNRTVIQMVMVQTNLNTNVTATVRFLNDGDEGATVMVGFNITDFDLVLQRNVTNTLFLNSTLAFETNLFYAKQSPAPPSTKRPNTMMVSTEVPCSWSFGVPANSGYSPSLISDPSYLSNNVPVLYSAYEAGVNLGNSSGTYVNPATLPGTIQIIGDNLSLDQTRIRSENTVAIKTSNLISNKVAKVDAPYLIYDLTSMLPELVVSNLAPASVKRTSGTIAGWSAIWTNRQVTATTTNELAFQLLIVESSIIFDKPATVDSLTLKAPTIALADSLNVATSFKIDTTDLTVRNDLTLPFGSTWAGTNVLNLLNYTNKGNVTIYKAAYLGSDRSQPYSSFVNYGNHTAAAHLINAGYFESQGCVQSSNGTLSVVADRVRLVGVPLVLYTNYTTNVFFFPPSTNVTSTVFSLTNAPKLVANGDLTLTVNDFVLSNATIQAGATIPARLDISAATRWVDSGQGAINQIVATAGINVLTRPPVSDLLATYVTCLAAENSQSFNTWAGNDLGLNTAGFTNNLAIGKLTLDGGNFSLFRFSAPEGQTGKALYVDYLELLNNATNYLSGALSIDPSITIYFANANVPATKLDKSNGGRIRWVKSFAGPLSSTNIVYPSGNTYTFNTALVTEKNLDSDCDGIVNANDPTPIYTGDQATLTATHSSSNKVTLAWTAICGAGTFLESKPSFAAPTWQTLTQFTNTGLVNSNVTYIDTASNTFKIYRLRVNPPQP